MAPSGSWFSRVFSNDATRGLSGDVEYLVGEESAFYGPRLRLQAAGGDIVQRPELLWTNREGLLRKGGLLAHLQADRSEAVARFTDAFIILAAEDHARAREAGRLDAMLEHLRGELAAWCAETSFNPVFPDRPIQVALLEDGSLGDHRLGLEPGTFVTGLVPNRYAAPLPSSAPILDVHLALPGAWEGYRVVGRLYGDQLVYTIGDHWLDNFRHPALEAPAIYQLQQGPDGSLVHVVNPDLQDRYRIVSTETADGPTVLGLLRDDGSPVAWIVLALVDSFVQEASAAEPAPRPDALLRTEDALLAAVRQALADELPAPDADPDPNPTAAAPSAPKAAESPAAGARVPLAQGRAAIRLAGDGTIPPAQHRTIVPEAMEERILTLKERGALLQKIHFSRFMEGYDVYVSGSGQLGTALANPAASFQVRGQEVWFEASQDEIRVGDRPLPRGRRIRLSGEVEIRVGGTLMEYRDLSGVAARGWPYLGEIRRAAASTYMVFGGTYRIGRDRRCRLRLPDAPHNDNIVWRQGISDGDVIRSRTGDIPKSRFYNDSIMVASEHAEVDLAREAVLRNVARHCFVFVRRPLEVVSLSPAGDETGLHQIGLLPGDEVLVGNSLFEVSYPPDPARRPRVQEPLTPEHLARAAVSTPDLDEASEPPTVPQAPPRFEPLEAPAAGGLGEAGQAPPALSLPEQGLDSILGFEAPSPRILPPEAPASKAGAIVAVEESRWQVELSRPARLVLTGWIVLGDWRLGNHASADAVVPECSPGRTPRPVARDHFRGFCKGRRAWVEVVDTMDARLRVGTRVVPRTEDMKSAVLEILRRDEDGSVDLTVRVQPRPGQDLPDPRAWFLALDLSERLAEGLFTLGLPLRTGRQLDLGTLRCTACYDGRSIEIGDYLDTYARPDGTFHPFFLRSGPRPFRTVREDGEPFQVEPGDLLVAGGAVYRFDVT